MAKGKQPEEKPDQTKKLVSMAASSAPKIGPVRGLIRRGR